MTEWTGVIVPVLTLHGIGRDSRPSPLGVCNIMLCRSSKDAK